MELVYRHEKPLFRIAVVISAVFWLLLIVGTLGIALVYILFAFIIYLFTQSAFIAHVKGNGVRITKAQYPDLYQCLASCCQRIGVTEPPEMYLLRTDFFNALATKFLGRNFIVLFTDVVDALENEQGAIDFYVGHELGHIHRKHLSWMAFLFPALLLPVLGTAYRRAQEYTCDRYGAACCDNDDQVRAAMAAISAGNTRWGSLNQGEYFTQIPATGGFWMSFHELTGDYPWLTKRMASALAFRHNQDLRHPRRNILAWVLSVFVPRFGAGGGVSLLITVVLIGVLAAIAIPAYQDYSARAAVGASLARVAPLRAAIEQYAIDNQAFPSSLDELGLAADAFAVAQSDHQVGVYENGIIGINIGHSATGEGEYVVLEPGVDDDGRISWICYGENVRQQLLPASCQN